MVSNAEQLVIFVAKTDFSDKCQKKIRTAASESEVCIDYKAE